MNSNPVTDDEFIGLNLARRPMHISDWRGVSLTSDPMPIADGLTATFTAANGGFTVAWHPRPPRSRRKIWTTYVAARTAFLDRVLAETGLRVNVIDL